MDFFDYLQLAGGLSLFLFGMKYMGNQLENRAGDKLNHFLKRFTGNKYKGFLFGAISAALVQSSSAVTVMTVGFVNSGLLPLSSATGVIIGSNVGTTVTAWILSLTGIKGDSFFLTLLKPSSLAPIAAVIGILLYNIKAIPPKIKNTGGILLGFSVLMLGLNTMSESAAGIQNEPWAVNLFTVFTHPIASLAVGIIITALVQSSSASIGILQTLSLTGAITRAGCVPVILGQNIGTCVTTLISSIGTGKNAKSAAFIHLYFNVFSAVAFYAIYLLITAVVDIEFLNLPADSVWIASVHTVFNIFAAAVMLPLSSFLEKIAIKTAEKNS